ncbi:MAG: cytochrome P450, partial [Acidimicrobiia bacterium]
MAQATLHSDLGDPHADINSHDTFVRAFPHAYFSELRKTRPVTWIDESGGAGFWAVTKHADVIEVSRDYKRFTASR